MPNNAGGIGRLVVTYGPKAAEWAMKHGPRINLAVEVVSAWLKDHPAIQDWARAQLTRMGQQLDVMRRRRGVPAQIRGKLDIVRQSARTLDDETADTPTTKAAFWTRKADAIEVRVGMAEKLSQPEQDRRLAGLDAETETLIGELMDAIAGAGPDDGSAQPSTSPAPEAGTEPAPESSTGATPEDGTQPASESTEHTEGQHQ